MSGLSFLLIMTRANLYSEMLWRCRPKPSVIKLLWKSTRNYFGITCRGWRISSDLYFSLFRLWDNMDVTPFILLLWQFNSSILNPLDTGRKLNVYKTFRRHPGRLLNVLCTFNLRLVSRGKRFANYYDFQIITKYYYLRFTINKQLQRTYCSIPHELKATRQWNLLC